MTRKDFGLLAKVVRNFESSIGCCPDTRRQHLAVTLGRMLRVYPTFDMKKFVIACGCEYHYWMGEDK